jgi:hypothetical protein
VSDESENAGLACRRASNPYSEKVDLGASQSNADALDPRDCIGQTFTELSLEFVLASEALAHLERGADSC